MTRTKCPICGGELQATREQWLSDIRVSDDCSTMTHEGYEPQKGDVIRIYCENDHDQVDMQEHVQSEFAQPVPGEERLDISGDPVGDAMNKESN